MYMIIIMVTWGTIILAEGVFGWIISCGNDMDNAYFYKNLQGSVNRNTVKSLSGKFFDIRMRKSTSISNEKMENF